MFQNVDLNTAQFINDYRINLIAPNEIKDFSMFKTELGKVLEFLNASDDLETEKYEEEEEINVCKAIDDMIQEAVQEKENQMCKVIEDKFLEGEQKGVQRKLIEQICKKIKRNKSLDVIADELEEDINEIRSIYEKVIEYAPDCDADAIYDKIIR